MTRFRCILTVSTWIVSAVCGVADDGTAPVEPQPVTLGRPVDFAQDIHPILQANCVACHNIAIDEGDLSLENVAGILKGGSSGPAVVPGNPDESLLLAAVSQNSETIMPPPENDVEAKPLTPRELGLLRQWILEGAGRGQSAAGTMFDWRSIAGQFTSIGSVDVSTHGRFAAVARGNQVEIHDLALRSPAERLIDPMLSTLGDGEQRLYPQGAADRDIVHAVAFDPSGTTLATAGYRAVKLWRRTHGGQATPLGIADAAFLASAADGSVLAVASQHEVRRVKPDGTTPAESWTTPASIVAVAAAGDSRIAAACEDGTIYVWQTGQNEPIRRCQSSSAAIALCFAGAQVITGHDDGTVRLWDAAADAPQHEWTSNAAIRLVHAVTTDGQRSLVAVGRDGGVRVWNVDSREKTQEFALSAESDVVAVSPDGQLIASADRSGVTAIRQIADGAVVGEHRAGIDVRRKQARAVETRDWTHQLAAVAQSRLTAAETALADRETILQKAIAAREAAGKAVEAAQAADLQATNSLKTAQEQFAAAPQNATAEAKSSLETAEAQTKESRQKLTEAEESLRSSESAIRLAETAVTTMREQQAACRDEKQSADVALAKAEQDLRAAVVEAESAVLVTGLAFTGTGDRLVVVTDRGTWETCSPTGAPLDVFTATGVSSLIAGFGDDLCGVDAEGAAHRYDTAGRWEYAGVLGPPEGSPLDLSSSSFADRVLALAFSPDGRLLVTGGGEPSRTGELMIWNVDERTHVATIDGAHSDTIQAVDVSRDGRLIATGSADKFARLFDLHSHALVRTFEGHTNHVTGVSVSADATTIATASADNSVKVWDVVTGEQKKTIPGFGKPVTAIAHVGLTDELVTSCGDKLVRRHSTSSGQQLQAFSGATDYVQSVAACAETATVAAGGEDGVLYLWNAGTGELLRRIEPATQVGDAAGDISAVISRPVP